MQVEHLQAPENSKLLEGAKVVYSAGFFITACSAAVEYCAKHCTETGKTYALVRSLMLALLPCEQACSARTSRVVLPEHV